MVNAMFKNNSRQQVRDYMASLTFADFVKSTSSVDYFKVDDDAFGCTWYAVIEYDQDGIVKQATSEQSL